jgi:hypothetical protein
MAALAVGLTGLVGVRPAPAGAQQARLEAARSAATAAVTRRVLALRELTTGANSIIRLSEANRAALTTQIQAQITALSNLNAKIQGDTDEATLRADAQKIVEFRVYVLTIPKARSVVASDIELNAVERLTRLADRLAQTIGASKQDTATAEVDLAALRAKLVLVTSAVSPLAAGLLALEPGGYPANRSTLDQTRAALRTSRTALVDAAALARRVIADLK